MTVHWLIYASASFNKNINTGHVYICFVSIDFTEIHRVTSPPWGKRISGDSEITLTYMGNYVIYSGSFN